MTAGNGVSAREIEEDLMIIYGQILWIFVIRIITYVLVLCFFFLKLRFKRLNGRVLSDIINSQEIKLNLRPGEGISGRLNETDNLIIKEDEKTYSCLEIKCFTPYLRT